MARNEQVRSVREFGTTRRPRALTAELGGRSLSRILVEMDFHREGGDLNRFVLVVEFDVKAESLEKFNQLIAVNAQASVREEPGCRQFDVLQDLDNPHHVVLYEVYDSAEAFQAHLGMPHTQTFLSQAKALVNKQTAYKLKRTVAPPIKA